MIQQPIRAELLFPPVGATVALTDREDIGRPGRYRRLLASERP
jgi:hypothetical protein